MDVINSLHRAARAGNLKRVLELVEDDLVDINASNNNGLTVMHSACKEGHTRIVEELLARGANVHAKTLKGNQPIHIASLAGHEQVVRVLLDHGADVNAQSTSGFTSLYMAAQENHEGIVRLLLDRGADQNISTTDGFTPLAVSLQQNHENIAKILLNHEARGQVRFPGVTETGRSLLHVAAKKNDCAAAALLLQNNIRPDVTSKSNFTSLHVACHYGNVEVAKLLIDNQADVNYQAKQNITPLHVAARWNQVAMVNLLLDHGAKIDARTKDHLTPLHCAARMGHDACVELLIKRGAPISAKTRSHLVPLHMSAQGNHLKSAQILLNNRAPVDDVTIDHLTSLHVASHCGHVKVAKLLLDHKADPNLRAQNGFTSLHIACKKNHLEIVKLLLKYGASLKAVTESGLSCLHIASFMGCVDIVIYLLEHNADIEAQTIRGETPLILATRSNQLEVIDVLLRYGANANACDQNHQNALHLAARLGNAKLAKLLIDRGIDIDAPTRQMYTALHIASKENHENVVALMLDHDANISCATRNHEFLPLHLASKYGNDRIVELLLNYGAPVDARGKNDVTSLMVASHYDHPRVVELLLMFGASPHAIAKNGYTAIHIAAKGNRIDCANTLLQNGADPNVESKAGFCPLHLASQEGRADMAALLLDSGAQVNCRAKNGITPLHLCAQEDHVNVAQLLVKYGAHLDAQTRNGFTPLHVACHFTRLRMIRFLLANGANVNIPAASGYTSLHQASQQGNSQIVDLLLQYNAQPGALTDNGHSALSIAENLGHVSVIDTLRIVTETVVKTTKTTITEEKFKIVAPETMQETFVSDSEDEADDTPAHQETIHFLTSDVMRSFNQSNMADDNYSTSQSNLPAAGAPVAAPHAQRQRSTDRDGQRAPGEGSGRGGQRPTRIADEMSQDLHDLSRDAPLDGGESTFGGYSTLGGSQLVQPAGGAGGEAQSSQQQRTPLLRTPTPGDDASELENNYERTDFRINDDDDDAADQLAAGQHVQATEQQLEQLAPDNVDIQRPLQQAGLITTTIDDDGDDDANERERKALEESSRAQIEAGHLDNALELGTGQPNAQSLNDAQDHSSRSLPVESSLQLNTRTQHSKPFLVSFMVDARGGAMRGCRHSGVRVIIPPNSAPQPMRITCRYLRRERLVHPPPLMEGEACASKIIEVGPAGAKFLGPVLIEVPHFASLRGREREIIILRSDHGEVWREHLVEADENLIDMIVKSAELVELQQQQQQGSLERDGQENRPPSALGGGLGGGGGSSSGGGDSQQQERRLTRIVTNEFPQYFAIISRIRQEVHTVGPEGSIVDSQTVPRVQANFTDGALTKRIKIGLQNEPQEYEPYYLVEQRTRSPSGGRRTVSPSSGGGKRKSRFLSCFGANHERSRGELGFASSSNDESPSSSEGGDSPRQYAVVRPHAQRRPDVSDSEGDSLGTLTRSPPQQQQQHTHRRPRPHSLAACEFVPDDYYIEREPPLILYGERPTYGKRMASSSAQTDSSGYRPHKGKRRGFLVSSRPSRSKTQMQIPYYEPAVIYYPSSQQQQQQRSPRRPKSADPRTSSPGGGGGGYSSLEDVSDDVTSPTSTLDSRQPSKFRTCTIQTDSDSVTVQYVTLAAVPPNNAAAAASATTTTSTDGIRPAGTPFDDGYVSGSGDAKKGFYRHQQHPSGVVQTNGRKTGRHFLPSCISTEDDDTYGDYDLSREDTIIIEEDGRPVRHLSRKPSSRPGSRTTSLSRNTSLSRADSPIPTKTVEKVITTTTTIMGQSFEEPLTSGEEADESLSTSTKQPSSTNVKLTKKQEKLYLKELAKERAKAEKEAKKKHKITPPDDASRPQSPSPVPAAPAVKPSQNVKFAPSPNKDYRQEVPPVSESFTVEQPTVVHNIREIERTLEPPGQVDVEHDDSLVPLSIGEPTLAYEPPTTTAQAPLKPILKQQWSGDYDEPKSISSMADRIVTTVTDQALQEFRPRTPSIEDDLPQTSKEIETLDFHFTDEEPKESKRDREKRRKTKRDEERRLVKEAHKLAKEAERAAKEAQRQAVVAQKESVRAKRIAELSQVERDVLSTTSEFFVKTDEPKVPEMPKVPTITVEQQPKQPEVETIDPQHVDTPPVATLERQPVDETIDLHHIERPPVKPLTVQEPSQVIAVEEQIRPVTPTKRPRIKPKGSRLNCFKVRKPKRSISGSQDSLSRVRQPETEVTQVVIDEHTFEAEQVQEPKEKPRTKSPKGPTASCFSCARKPKTTDPLDDETSPKVEEPGKPSERLEGAKPKRPSTSCFSCARKPKTTDSQEDISQVRPEPETEVTREILDEQTFETGPKVEQPAETIERIEESGKKPEGLDVAKPKRPTTSCFSCARKPKTTDSQEDVSARELHQPETEVTREVLEEQTFPQTEQKSDKPEKLSAKPKKSGTSCLSCARKPKRADSDEDLSRVRQPETEVTREVLEEQTFPQTEQKSDKPEELSARPKKSGTSCFSCARKPKTTDSQEDVSAQELRQPETEVTREVLEEQTFPQTEQKPDKPDKLSAKPKKSGTSCLSCGRKPKRADSDEDLSRVRQPETEVTREVLDEQTFETGPKVEQPAETSTIERIEVPEQKPQKLATLKPKRPSSSCFSCARKPKTTDSQEDVSARERGPETEVTREVLDEQTFETDPKGERETPTIERIEEPAKDPERLDAAKPKRPSSSCFSCAGKVKKTDSLDEGSFPTGETRVEGGKIKARSKELRDQKRKKRSIWSRIFRSRRTEPKQVEVIETTTTSRFDLPVGEQPRESPVPVNQQIVSEMYPRDPDNVDGEMILEVNVPKEFVREPQMPSAPPLQTEQSPMKPPRQQLPEPVVPVDEPQPRVPVDESIDSDRVEQPPVRPLELVPAPEPEQPIEEPRQTPVDETIDSDRVQRPPVAPLAELPSRPREPSIEREPETIEPAPETSRREEPEVTEITTEITREVIDHVENVQTPEDKKERKRREKEEKLREKQRLKEEKERLKREAKEAKRLLKLAKLEAKKPKAKVEPKQQVVTPEVQQPQQPGKPATTTTSTVTTSTTIRGDPSTLNDDVGSELPVEPSRDGGRVLISKTSEVPIDENNEVERIVEEVVGDDGTVTKTTKIVETKYVTMRQEEIRVAEHRDIPTDEWDRIRAERSQSPQASISHASHLAQPQGHHCHAGTGVVETTRSKRHYIVREARDDRATRELDEIVATPSCFDVERVPEGVDLRASIKKQFAKRVKMNQKIIKRAQKLSWSEAKRAKRETLRAEHEIAICDCAAREARKELKRAVKEAKRAVKEAEKRHKKMDKIDKQIAKRQKKLEKRQRKIDKKMAKAAKKQAKRQAKSEKKAFKESLKRAGSSATSAKSIRLEDIGAPVLHSSSRHDLQRERSADSTGFVERHLIVTEETTRTNTSDGCGVCPYAPTAGAAAAAITEADVQQVPSVTRSAVITTIGQSVSPEVPMSLDDSTTLIQQQQQQQQADADQAKSLDDAANMHSELNASRDEADDDVIDVVGLDDDEQEHEGAPSSAHVITGNLSVAAEKANQERAERPPLTPVQSIKHEEPNVDCREEPRNVTSLQAHKLEALVHDPEGQEESQPNEEDLPQEKQPETDEASQVVSKNDPGLSFDPEEAQNKQTSQAVLGEESSEPPQPTEAPTDDEPEVLSLEAPKLEALIREPEAPEESHKPQEERPSIEATAEKVDVQAPQASASESPLDDSSDPLEDDRQQKQQEQQQADDASGEGQESQKKPAQKKRPRKKNKK